MVSKEVVKDADSLAAETHLLLEAKTRKFSKYPKHICLLAA